ncbi:MAG TPA: NADH-quinone oxidoreductase subunit M [Xanthobacteraceae bacterium]|jgi:NADH-quinone oxidoreductase subunit M
MILLWLILTLLIGGVAAWLGERRGAAWSRWISLIVLAVELALVLTEWAEHYGSVAIGAKGAWFAEINWPWIAPLGISFHLGMDGLSLVLILLTVGLGIASVAASWTEITDRVGFFHFNLLWILAGVVGVFLALDLFLFFLFWELMLVPTYFLIAVWGHERRYYASMKFFLFTQGSGLLMFVAILALFFIQYRQSGTPTFDYFALAQVRLDPTTEMWLMLGFFVAFAVKLPAVPFHTWLPDAHTEAPTAGSVILAGLLLKTGAYGLLRFAVPLFPNAAHTFAPAAMTLGVIGILYGAMLAFAQDDMKRLVAYTSVSHLGFVLLGIYAWNTLALQGAVMQMLAHGLSTGALFILVGALQERLHTRDMRLLGGLWTNVPRLAAIGMFFAIASLGLPGLGNFVGEFLILFGTYRVAGGFAIAGTVGLVAATIYALIFVQRVFHGENRGATTLLDFSARHMIVMSAMIATVIWLGFYPQPVFDTAGPGLDNVQRIRAELALAAR